MADLFEEHAQEFAELSIVATHIISTKVKGTQGTQKSKAVKEAQAKISEMKEAVDQMEMLAREQTSKEAKTLFLRRVTGFQSELSELEKTLRKTAAAFTEADRAELFIDETNMDMDDLTGSDQRQLLARNTARLQQTGRRIEEAERQTLEIQDIGIGVLDDLSTQRATLGRARASVLETDSNLRKSMRVANSMGRRVWQNKLLMYGIMAFLVAAVALVIYLKWGR